MKKQIIVSLLIVILAITSIGLSGCEAPGLTRREVHMRHYDTIQVELWQIQDDIDRAFLFDRPGRLHNLVVR